jgi:hypothetical protein
MRDRAELLDHDGSHIVHGLHTAEFVGIGEKIAFERRRAGSDVGNESGLRLCYFEEVRRGTESGGLDGAGDIEHGEALRDDHGMEINVTTAEALLEVDDVRRFLEEIFSGL